MSKWRSIRSNLTPITESLQTLRPTWAFQKRQYCSRFGSSQSANQSKHHLPKIQHLLSDRDRWSDIKGKEAYEYPGFTEAENSISYCSDITKREELGSSQRPHFTWDDCQLTKRGCSTPKLFVKTGTEKTVVWVRHAF